MTIAALYVSPEGVVLGADSTSSFFSKNNVHYFDFAQKLFEVGEKSTLGFLTWGMGGLGEFSYRRLVAELDDDLHRKTGKSPTTVREVADKWVKLFDARYRALPGVLRAVALSALQPHDKANPVKAGHRSLDEQEEFEGLLGSVSVGFCFAGYVPPSREPSAIVVLFSPTEVKAEIVVAPKHALLCYGMPNAMNRLLFGADQGIIDSIVASGKWGDTPDALIKILENHRLLPRAVLPLRDAVDYVHSGIYLTIKATKFSTHPQTCGGPIEIAVISSDRKFRWVRHKQWDAAITDGDI